MSIRVAVIGGGSWGTTVAHLCAKNTPTTLWARRDDVATEVRDLHTNSAYLSGFDLTPSLHATSSLEEAVGTADVLVMGVPSHGMRDTAKELVGFLRPWVPVISLSKGLEQGTRLRMTQVLGEELPGHPCGVLTGPNLAKEILAGEAAASVVAMEDVTIAEALQDIFASDVFRVYTNPDVIGCEVAGALKNVMAIASGMADGLGTGDNTRAAVITRGLAELTRLGCAMGGQQPTFAGLAGMGDLIATCISPQSRNRYVGEQLGKGRKIDEIVDEMNMVAEGVKTSKVVMELANDYGVDLPIAASVHAVVHEGAPATEAYRGLLGRQHRSEMHGMPSE
jgi:glycerol-3-phosphate dehydrogenase (NAD(P)+)